MDAVGGGTIRTWAIIAKRQLAPFRCLPCASPIHYGDVCIICHVMLYIIYWSQGLEPWGQLLM